MKTYYIIDEYNVAKLTKKHYPSSKFPHLFTIYYLVDLLPVVSGIAPIKVPLSDAFRFASARHPISYSSKPLKTNDLLLHFFPECNNPHCIVSSTVVRILSISDKLFAYVRNLS